MTDERAALVKAVNMNTGSPRDPGGAFAGERVHAVMAAADVYAAAERLDEHVKTCEREGPPPSYADMHFTQKCGTGDPIYYCDRAPKEGRHDG